MYVLLHLPFFLSINIKWRKVHVLLLSGDSHRSSNYFMFSTVHLGTNYLGHVQSMRKIVQILVCFSESLNFNIIFIIFLGMWLSTTHSIIVKQQMMCMHCKKEFASFFYLFVGCHWRSILQNSSRQHTFIVSTAFCIR